MSFMPAATILAILEGLRVLSLDVARIQREASIPPELRDPDQLLPGTLFGDVLRAARAQAPQDELLLQIGLSVPLGAFGLMDYLAASSDTVGEAFVSLRRLFPSVAPGCAIDIDESPSEYRITLINEDDYATKVLGDELTVGVMIRHFRAFSERFPLFAVDLVRLTPQAPEAFGALLGVPVRFAQTASALRLSPEAPQSALKSRDPRLNRTLEAMASRLGLGAPAPPLEMVIRSRLRELLPAGNGDVTHVAASLALSTRTLHRKLAELGRSFHDVLSDFRRAEAERLLSLGESSLTEVALRLGFADQSAFSRAFKRWTERSPSEWRSAAPGNKNSRHKPKVQEPT
jgi:AraC-like DNA-binding protein